MAEDDLTQHVNWNAVLRWSMEFQETPAGPNRDLRPLDAERRRFLEQAFGEIVGDPVKSMRAHMEVIKNTDSSKDQVGWTFHFYKFLYSFVAFSSNLGVSVDDPYSNFVILPRW